MGDPEQMLWAFWRGLSWVPRRTGPQSPVLSGGTARAQSWLSAGMRLQEPQCCLWGPGARGMEGWMSGRLGRESRGESRPLSLSQVVRIGAESNNPLSAECVRGPLRCYLIGPSQFPWKGGGSIIPSLQLWKLRPRDV